MGGSFGRDLQDPVGRQLHIGRDLLDPVGRQLHRGLLDEICRTQWDVGFTLDEIYWTQWDICFAFLGKRKSHDSGSEVDPSAWVLHYSVHLRVLYPCMSDSLGWQMSRFGVFATAKIVKHKTSFHANTS